MEKRLYDAAVRADTSALSQLLEEDPYLLDRAYLNCCHEDKNAHYITAILGNEPFVKAILDSPSSYHMRLARDRDGRNPLHLAAIHGKLNILKLIEDYDELVQAALAKADRGGTILHLCVEHNQLEAMKLLLNIFKDPEFVGAINKDGITILHLAIYYNQNQRRRQIIIHLINNSIGIFNIKNGKGKTTWELLLGQAGIELEDSDLFTPRKKLLIRFLKKHTMDQEIALSLLKSNAYASKNIISMKELRDWELEIFEKARNAVMVVASLIATMAFQGMVNPPGGVWQEDKLEGPNPHRAGTSVMAQTHPIRYTQLIRANTIAFVSSLSIVIVLVRGLSIRRPFISFGVLTLVMWLSVAAIAVAYAISLVTITPAEEALSGHHLSAAAKIAIIVIMVWSFVLIAIPLEGAFDKRFCW